MGRQEQSVQRLFYTVIPWGMVFWLFFRQHSPRSRALDLKACFRGHKYVIETLKWLPKMPEPILLAQIYDHIASFGSIHSPKPGSTPS